jgi:hypothetical protein
MLAHCTYLVVHQIDPNSIYPDVGQSVLAPLRSQILARPYGLFSRNILMQVFYRVQAMATSMKASHPVYRKRCASLRSVEQEHN